MAQKNDFNNSNFNNNQINNIDLSTTNNYNDTSSFEKSATYNAEPLWRTPVTLATLAWLGVPSSLIAIFSLFRVFIFQTSGNIKFIILFVIAFMVLILCLWLYGIIKRQIRIPLKIPNYALNGYGGKIILEKIIPNPCPICGGEMFYHKKLVDYDLLCQNGATKQINKRFYPFLQCKRNPSHCFSVDIAEEHVE